MVHTYYNLLAAANLQLDLFYSITWFLSGTEAGQLIEAANYNALKADDLPPGRWFGRLKLLLFKLPNKSEPMKTDGHKTPHLLRLRQF